MARAGATGTSLRARTIWPRVLGERPADLTSPLNGYFLQFGENGALDAVELFQQNGTNTVSVCRGTDGRVAAAFTVGIRVTRDGTRTWSACMWIPRAERTTRCKPRAAMACSPLGCTWVCVAPTR